MLASVIFCRRNASLLFITSLKFLPEKFKGLFYKGLHRHLLVFLYKLWMGMYNSKKNGCSKTWKK